VKKVKDLFNKLNQVTLKYPKEELLYKLYISTKQSTRAPTE